MSQSNQTGKNSLICFVALGSNASSMSESSVTILQKAITAISKRLCSLNVSSQFYQTPCFPAGAGPDYVNAVIEVTCELSAGELLAGLHDIEAEFGRVREVRWGQRTLDLDLIAFGDEVMPNQTLVREWMDLPLERQKVEAPDQLLLPHPRLQDRAFVLVPMAEIAPNWRHPILHKTVSEMLAALPEGEKAEVIAI